MSRLRRHLGTLLVAIGIATTASPIAMWGYGLYWQKRMADDFDRLPSVALHPINKPPKSVAKVLNSKALIQPQKTASARIKNMPKPLRRALKTINNPPTAPTALEPQPIFSAPIGTVPASRLPRPDPGEPFARLSIKRIGLDAIVVEGTDRISLRRGPGHLPNTGIPGESRNCAFAAHRDGWFLRLPEVRSGDAVTVDTKQGRYIYTVGSRQVVNPNRVDLLDQGPRPVLTLITCTGSGYPHSKQRLLVFCSLKTAYPR